MAEASLLMKEEPSNSMDIVEQTPARMLIIQFHFHLSTNSG